MNKECGIHRDLTLCYWNGIMWLEDEIIQNTKKETSSNKGEDSHD